MHNVYVVLFRFNTCPKKLFVRCDYNFMFTFVSISHISETNAWNIECLIWKCLDNI